MGRNGATRTGYRRRRFHAESLIERAISILDTRDGDADPKDDAESQIIRRAGADDHREWTNGG